MSRYWPPAVVLLLGSSLALAEATTVTVYRHVGADGVVTFSDEAIAGAEPITVESDRPHPDDVALLDERYDRQLELIDVLAADRQAQEAAAAQARTRELEIERERARARAAWAASEAAQPDYRYVYAPWYAPWPRAPHDRPRHAPGPGHGGGPPPEQSPPPLSRPLGAKPR
jgi:hypothetical protein